MSRNFPYEELIFFLRQDITIFFRVQLYIQWAKFISSLLCLAHCIKGEAPCHIWFNWLLMKETSQARAKLNLVLLPTYAGQTLSQFGLIQTNPCSNEKIRTLKRVILRSGRVPYENLCSSYTRHSQFFSILIFKYTGHNSFQDSF